MEVVSNCGGSINAEPGKIFEPDMIVENDAEDWYLEDIMTAEKVDASGLCSSAVECTH